MHQELLLKIARDLDSQEVEKLKFLCRSLVPQKKLETVNSALELFQVLQQLELLGEDRLFLSELLHTIYRLDLLRMLGTSQEEVKESLCRQTSYYCRVSPYRKMLYELSENISVDTLKSMKFLLKMPFEIESASFFKVVELMEKLDRLSEDKTEDLYQVLLDCKENRLASKVKEYAVYIKGGFAETSKDPAMFVGPVMFHWSMMYGGLAASYSPRTTCGSLTCFSSATPCGPAASGSPLMFGGPATFHGSMMYGGPVTSYSLPTTYGTHTWFSPTTLCGPAASGGLLTSGWPTMYGGPVTSYSSATTHVPLTCFSPATSGNPLTSGWPGTFHGLMMCEGLVTSYSSLTMYGPLTCFSSATPCGPAG